MEFSFDLGQIFTGDVCKIASDMLPADFPRATVHYKQLAVFQQQVTLSFIHNFARQKMHSRPLKNH